MIVTRAMFALFALTAALPSTASASDEGRSDDDDFRLSSNTFANNSVLPLSMIDSFVMNNVSTCTADGLPGGNQSPQLSWKDPPSGTRSFVVIAFDESAAFTHWGIYNISAKARSLPANAGVANSTFGPQINNDFGSHGYEGPCPPQDPTLKPVVHHYVFTIYALDRHLHLSASPSFPANSETLLRALAETGEDGGVLESASVGGFYSSVPP